MQDAQQAQGFVLERLQEQAVRLGSDAAAMPTRVAAIGRCGSLSPVLPVTRHALQGWGSDQGRTLVGAHPALQHAAGSLESSGRGFVGCGCGCWTRNSFPASKEETQLAGLRMPLRLL